MTETLLLVVFAFLVLALLFAIRMVVARRKIAPLTHRVEAIIRIALCMVFALIAHAWYQGTGTLGYGFALSTAVSALVIYAVTHLFDRLILKADK